MNKSRVLICVVDNRGGMADVARAYLDFFSQSSDASLSLVILRERRESLTYSEAPGVTILEAEDLLDPEEQRSLRRKIEELVKKHPPEIIVVDAMGAPLFSNVETPLVADVHYLMAMNNSFTRGLSLTGLPGHVLKAEEDHIFRQGLLEKQMVEKKLFSRAYGIICNSTGTQADLKKFYPQISATKKIEVVDVGEIVSGIDFIPPSLRKNEFAYCGRFNSLKGVDLLPRVAKRFPAFKLAAFGLRDELIPSFQEYFGDAPNLSLYPWVENQRELQKLLSKSKFHLFPSYYEPWGLSLTKALKAGAICIANVKASGHLAQLRDGENGFLLDFDQPEFFDRLASILEMDDKSLDMIAQRNQEISADPVAYVNSVVTFTKKVLHEKN